MKKNKKIKLYIHHGQFQEIEVPVIKKVRLLRYPATVLFSLCYYTGLLVWNSGSVVGRIIYTIVRAPKFYASNAYKHLLRNHSFRFTLSVFITLIILSLGFLRGTAFITKGLELKSRVLGVADLGLTNLTEAQTLLKTQETGLAEKKFNQALEQFKQSQADMAESGSLINNLLGILPQTKDGENLLEAGKLISQAGLQLTQFYTLTNQLLFTQNGLLSSGAAIPEIIPTLGTILNKASYNIRQANILVSSIGTNIIPLEKQATFLDMKQKLSIAAHSLDTINSLMQLGQQVLLGKKHILLLFQNNNELRSTGGFIGTYGALNLTDGGISSIHISSIYDLDGQLAEHIAPPFPLRAVNDRWFLRDSNWFANFPDSAQEILSFYEKEGGQTPDLIIALTPTLITDILTLTGPVDMPKYGQTLDADNFIEHTQVATSVLYNKEGNAPKQLLSDFFPVLLNHIANFEPQQNLALLNILQRDLAGKQGIIYAKDETTQNLLRNFNWAGTIPATDRDYMQIVYSNLGGTKTDLYLERKAQLHSEITESGSITNTLTINVTNPLPNTEGMTNTSFVRVYVPKGSVLIKSSGFSAVDIPTNHDATLKNDPRILEWEQNTIQQVVSGTITGQEGDKAFFGNWLIVKGGETQTVTITYTLPFSLENIDHHSLLWQKQAGSNNSDINYQLDFPNKSIVWKNFNPKELDSNSLKTSFVSDKDYFLSLVLKER